MIRGIIFSLTVLILSGCSGEPVPENLQTEYEKIREGFQDPPPFARPKVYWWWLNGNADTGRLITEMRAMKDAGISGFDIFGIEVPASDAMAEAGPAFMSDESLLLIKTVIDEAGRLGMEAGLNMASSWNAGGGWIRPFNEYLARISFKAKESGFCADVLYYYRDQIPNYAGHKNSRFVVAPGCDYEVINTEILMQLGTVNGELVLPGGARFKILCLEDEVEINSEVLLKLKELAGSGSLIIG